MAQPFTSFDLSHEEMKKLPTDQKERLSKEWSNLIEEAKKKHRLRSDNSDHGFPYTNTHTNNTYEAPYSSHSGGPHRGRYRGTSYGVSRVRSGNGLVHPDAPNNIAPHNRHHPYPQPQRQRYQNLTAIFSRTGPSVWPPFSNSYTTGVQSNTYPYQAKKQAPKPATTLCSAFTSTGICTWTGCRYMHDQDKVAICKAFLYKDNCSNGDDCPLSHIASPHNTIACNHFRNGSCTKNDCRFAHVCVSPSAAVCEAFSRLGYCEKGSTCADRHAFDECPNFTNSGACKAGKDCPLVHVRHAGRLRKNNTLDDKASGIIRVDKSDNFGREALNVALNDQSDIGKSDESDISTFKAISPFYEIPGKIIDDQQDINHGLSEQADFIAFE